MSEAIERLVCSELNISTQGVAAHPVKANAETNAFNESVERALFQYHLENKIPFAEQSPTGEIADLLSAIQKYGGSISVRKMLPIVGCESSICIIQKDKQHFLGLGLGEEISSVQFKAIIEALRNFAVYCKNPDAFIEKTELNPDLWNCDPRFFEKHKSVLSKIEDFKSDANIKILKTSYENLGHKTGLELPVSVVKAEVTLGALS